MPARGIVVDHLPLLRMVRHPLTFKMIKYSEYPFTSKRRKKLNFLNMSTIKWIKFSKIISGKYVLLGVTSYGSGCATERPGT